MGRLVLHPCIHVWRFARQYRYEPPSEFPLTLPFADIVHRVLTYSNSNFSQLIGRLLVPIPCSHLHSAFRLTRDLGHVLDSLVRVLRRPLSQQATPFEFHTAQRNTNKCTMWVEVHPQTNVANNSHAEKPCRQTLVQQFQSLLTLFPKSFLSFFIELDCYWSRAIKLWMKLRIQRDLLSDFMRGDAAKNKNR